MDRDDLGLTEAQVRGAIRALEAVGFLDRAIRAGASRYQRTGAGELHRRPVLFRFGSDYAEGFIKAIKRSQKARERHSRYYRPSNLPAQTAERASTAFSDALGPSSPKEKERSDPRVFMGQLTRSPPPLVHQNPKLEAALERWKEAFEKASPT